MSRRSTRSSSGHLTSPEPEVLHDLIERSTRSKVASEDLVVLDLPKCSRASRHGASSEVEVPKEPVERSTRSRKVSGDPLASESSRNSRSRKRSSSITSPDVSRHSQKGTECATSGNKHKNEKRDPSTEEHVLGTLIKKRRRSGRLTETESELDKSDDIPKEDQVEDVEGKNTSQRNVDISVIETRHKHDTREHSSVEALKETSSKRRRRSGQPTERDSEKDIPKDNQKFKKEEKILKNRKGSSSREKGKKKDTEEDNRQNESQNESTAQENKEDSIVSTRRRTRSGRARAEEIDGNKEGEKTDSTQDDIVHPSRASRSLTRNAKEKGETETHRLRSPPRSPVKSKKDEATHMDDLKVDVDITELTVKTSLNESTKLPQSPPIRMSPRRNRQPSGQPVQKSGEPSEKKVEPENASIEEIESEISKTQDIAKNEDDGKDPKKSEKIHPESPRKENATRRDLSSEFEEAENSDRSPRKQSKSKRDRDISEDAVASVNDDKLKSERGKKLRSPVKSSKGDSSSSSSPRKGLRSSREPEVDVTTLEGTCELGSLDCKVDVEAMGADESSPIQNVSQTPADAIQGNVCLPEANSLLVTPELEEKQEPTINELLTMSFQTHDGDSVTGIPDDIATKIREWKVQEEDSVGFQGEEWYSEEVDEGEPFYFESDHMALKGNKDYRMLLRTITTLEAQRKQAIKDLDKLVVAQRDALRNPLKFVHKLQKKDTLHLPVPQRIVALPDIPWGRYLGHADSKELIQGLSHHTRASIKQKPDPSEKLSTSHSGLLPGAITSQSEGQPSEEEKNRNIIRGRYWDDTKPITFNRLWTVEEQKRLEELLVKYPSEEVEARRWEKIAKALGNRTKHQVASRVQKFFIKLGKAGLPIPGRMPHLSTYMQRKPTRKFNNTSNKMTMAPSTFYQSIRAPVLMDDNDGCEMEVDFDADSIMEEDDIPPELKDSEEFKELMRLKKLRHVTLKQQDEAASHVGFSCDSCGMSPIIGVRWHCVNCPADVSTDLCPNCVDVEFRTELHNSSHHLEPIHLSQSRSFVDSDYTSFTGTSGDYNYLDPNYSPAVLG